MASVARHNETVIVIGLGAMGAAAAHHLAKRGASVIGLERFSAAHDKGSSHGGSRIVRQSYFESPDYVPLLLRAYELWDELDRDSPERIRHECGGLFFGSPLSPTVAGSIDASRRWGLPHEVLDADEIRRRFPHLRPAEGEIGLYEKAAGFVRPELTVTENIRHAIDHGADLRFNTEVTGWEASGSGVTVRAGGQSLRGDRLVICPGAWTPKLLTDLGVPVQIERQVMYWFAPTGPIEPFVDGPVYIHEGDGAQQIYGFPAADGPQQGAKVAFFRKGSLTDPDAVNRTVGDDETDAMRSRLALTLPTLPGPRLAAKTCMYTTTPDQHFVIGAHPQAPNVFVACGFSGHGFKFTPVVGEILSDLALEGATRHPIGMFDPLRFAPS